MWDLWWTNWHWDRFFPEYFGFPLSISFHGKTGKKKHLIIFITVSFQGCGASVASAAGPLKKGYVLLKDNKTIVTHILKFFK
jgi:hypothetical protein